MLSALYNNFCLVQLVTAVVALLLAVKVYIKLTTGWCNSQTTLQGKVAIVTGANTGIGYETAADLAKRGAKVIFACRDKVKAEEAIKKLVAETTTVNVSVKLLDLSSLDSIRRFAKEILEKETRLDILVNNAGVGGMEDEKIGGLQNTMLINYYGPFLLTNLLLDLLKKSGPSRIVNVASIAAKWAKLDIDDINAFPGKSMIYFNSKLCNILFTIELANRLKDTKVTTYSVHPGVVDTDIFRKMPAWMLAITKFVLKNFCKNATEGAQTTIHCAVQEGIEKYSGEHFEDCQLVERYKTAKDPYLHKKVWDETEKLLKLI